MKPWANVDASKVDAAIETLRQKSIDAGLGGRLNDFDVCLCEDRQTISIWAFYDAKQPLYAHVMLDEPALSIDGLSIYRQLNAARSPLRVVLN